MTMLATQRWSQRQLPLEVMDSLIYIMIMGQRSLSPVGVARFV